MFSLTAGARRIYLFEAANHETSSLHYFFCESKLVELFPAYKRWYMRQDPVGEAFSAAPESNNVALQKVRPTDIASQGFRRRFFDDAGIVERVSIVQRGSDAWRGISIARHVSNGYCSDDEVRSLVGLGVPGPADAAVEPHANAATATHGGSIGGAICRSLCEPHNEGTASLCSCRNGYERRSDGSGPRNRQDFGLDLSATRVSAAKRQEPS